MSGKAQITQETTTRAAGDDKLADQITGFTTGKTVEERLAAVESAIASLQVSKAEQSSLDSLRYSINELAAANSHKE